MKKNTIKVLVSAGIGFVLAFLVMWSRGIFTVEGTKDILRVVCDGFFVAGAVLFLGGGLIWVNNGGVFDGLAYSLKQSIARMRRNYELHRESYADYREKRAAKATSPVGMVLGGLFHLVISVVLFVVYMKLFG